MSKKEVSQESIGLDPARPMFQISVVAELLEVHQRTLRIYDQLGLLVPGRTKEDGRGRRLYSQNDIERGRFIQRLTRDLGINIIGIQFIDYLIGTTHEDPNKVIDRIIRDLNITEEMLVEKRQSLSKRERKPSTTTA